MGQGVLVLLGVGLLSLAFGGGLAMGKELSDIADVDGKWVGMAIFYYVFVAGLVTFGGFSFAAAGNLRDRGARAFRQFLNAQFAVWLLLAAFLIYAAAAFDAGPDVDVADGILIAIAGVLGIVAASVYRWLPVGLGDRSAPQPSRARDVVGVGLGLAALVLLLIGVVILPGKGVLTSPASFGLIEFGLRSFAYQFGGPIQAAGYLAILVGLAVGVGRGHAYRLAGLALGSAGLVTVGVGQVVHGITWHIDMTESEFETVHPWDLFGEEAVSGTIQTAWGFIFAGTELILLAGLAVLVLGVIALFVHGSGLFAMLPGQEPSPARAGQALGSPQPDGTPHQEGTYCPSCGSELRPGAEFCGSCGASA